MTVFDLASDQTAPLMDTLAAEAEDAWRHSPLSAIRRLMAVDEVRADQELDPSVFDLPRKGGVRGRAKRDPKNLRPVPGTGVGEILTPEVANQRVKEAGVKLKKGVPEFGITEGYLDLLINAAKDEQRLNEVFARASKDFWTGAARLGTGLGVSILDPINVASAFIPITGGTLATRAGASALRRVGVLGPSTAVAAALPVRAGARAALRLRQGAVEGAVGASIVEPIILSAAEADQADYDMTDSLLNIAFGTVIGGGLHVGVGALGDRLALRKVKKEFEDDLRELREIMGAVEPEGAANRALDNATEGDRVALMQGSVSHMASGRYVNLEPVATLHPIRLVEREEPNPAPIFETQDEEVLARISYPEEMRSYDALVKKRDDLRAQIDELAPERRAAADDAVEELQSQIDQLNDRMRGATKRNQKKMQARIDEMQKRVDAERARITSADTPAQAGLRQQLVAVDESLRDVAPRVNQIRREAQARAQAEAVPVKDRPEFILRKRWEVDPNVDPTVAARATYAPENLRLADPEGAAEVTRTVEENRVSEEAELDAIVADTTDLQKQYEEALAAVGLRDEDVGVDPDAREAEQMQQEVADLEKYVPAALACFNRRG